MTKYDTELHGPLGLSPRSGNAAQSLGAASLIAALLAAALALVLAGALPGAAAVAVRPLLRAGLLQPILAALVLAGASAGIARLRRRHAGPVAGAPKPLEPPVERPALAAAALAAGALALGSILAGAPSADAASSAFMALAACGAAACFPLLVAERLIAAEPPAALPERPGLRRLLTMPLVFLLLASAGCAAAACGLPALRPAAILLDGIVLLAAAELCARIAVARPCPPRSAAFLFDLAVLRPLNPRSVQPRAWAAELRARFGIDFARSWALGYAARAMLPLALVLTGLCVLLTGLVRIDTTQRGIYQRLGRPVAVLRPGLHLLLPWPLGQVRRVEYGVIHAVPVSFDETESSPDAGLLRAVAPPPPPTVEGPPPPAANRLWESAQPSDVTYLIASEAHPGATAGRTANSGFEMVSVSLRVLFRIGLDPQSARDAAYAVADPALLVRMGASQLLAGHLATRTLRQVLVEDRGGMAHSLQSGLQALLDRLHAGIEILSVVVEAAHPPGGAAAAYRQVQAAEIAANTAVSLERGRAETTLGLALRDAAQASGQAHAAAAERVAQAQAVEIGTRADEAAYRASPGAFLLERRLAAVQAALAPGTADIIDPRLAAAAVPPTLDLRETAPAAQPHQETPHE